MISRFKAVIFDMDGTLIDSMYAWRGVYREYIRNNGFTTPEEIVGVPEYPVGWAAKLLKDQLEAKNPPVSYEEAVEDMYRLVDKHYAEDAEARPGAIEFVKRLKERGILVAVATATPLRYANTALNRLGFENLFDLVLSNEEIGLGKSDEAYFRRVADLLGVKKEDCLIAEDAAYSIRTAKKAGFAVLAIEDYYAWREKEEIQSIADRYIACYADILEENW